MTLPLSFSVFSECAEKLHVAELLSWLSADPMLTHHFHHCYYPLLLFTCWLPFTAVWLISGHNSTHSTTPFSTTYPYLLSALWALFLSGVLCKSIHMGRQHMVMCRIKWGGWQVWVGIGHYSGAVMFWLIWPVLAQKTLPRHFIMKECREPCTLWGVRLIWFWLYQSRTWNHIGYMLYFWRLHGLYSMHKIIP